MFKKHMTIIVPRCPVCGKLMCMDARYAPVRIAITFPPTKAKRAQDAKHDIKYASFEICAQHLEEEHKTMLSDYLVAIHAEFGVDAPVLQTELS